MVKLRAADGHALDAYQAGEAGAHGAPRPGLVVVQEIFGVNHHIRSMCDRFAALGFLAIAPALFDRVKPGLEYGYATADVAKGRDARMKLTDEMVKADVEAAAKALGDRPLGIVGYCFGGTVTWNMACRTGLFRAASGWYGSGVAATRSETPRCPVQLHFAEHDHSIPLTDVALVREAQPGVSVEVYAGAEHGFGCDERASFHPPSFTIAFGRTLRLFDAHLRP